MRVCIVTLGCKVNEVDSELYAQELRSLGADITNTLNDADAVVVNSCSVTNRAQTQSLQLVRRALRERRGAPVYLTGCGASLLKLTHSEAPPGVIVVSMQDRLTLARRIVNEPQENAPRWEWIDETIVRPGPRNRVDVRIQEGCDNMCAYCIVPQVRGSRPRSKSPDIVIREIMNLAGKGVKEVVLTGTEIGRYGEAADALPALLDAIMRQLEQAQLATRVRISSLNPDAVSDELVEQFRIHRSLCPHLHLALQSGSDAVLRRMRRPYLSTDLASSVRRLRSFDADFALTTDIIVGFPGETEEDFLDTVDAVRTSAFAKVHVFPFSPRPFTPAARDPDQVPRATIRERVHRMLAVGAETGLHYAQRFIGRDVGIISEKVGLGRAEGYSEYYLWTEVRCEPQTMPARDILLRAAIDSCRYQGDRVILTGSVRS